MHIYSVNKSGLNQLLELVLERKVSKVVVLYKNMLARFEFEVIEELTHYD